MATLPPIRRGAYYCRVMHEDVWAEILKRLPMDNLCRFRCVCKWWNSIISSASFINVHYTFTFSTNLKPYLRVAYGDRVFTSHALYHPSHEHYTLCHRLEDEDNEQQLYFPFGAEEDAGNPKRFTFVDVIHGVVCIIYSSHSTFLWNPSIHKYVALPRLSLTCGAVGFGYDTSKNDFKVVGIDFISIGCMSFKVYSTRQGFWRRPTTVEIKHLDRYWTFRGKIVNSCFVNGTIHWLLSRLESLEEGLDYSVLMFDCESEEVKRMDIPREVFCSKYEIALFEYSGMLAALVRMDSSSMNLWVMEEHGVSTSWKKIERASYGPKNEQLSTSILCDHVYSKSMFLMDHPKGHSYASQSSSDSIN